MVDDFGTIEGLSDVDLETSLGKVLVFALVMIPESCKAPRFCSSTSRWFDVIFDSACSDVVILPGLSFLN